MEENICILEEAVAIRYVCKRREMTEEAHRQVSAEDVCIKLTVDLQEEQDKELATLLGMLVKMVKY